MDLETKIKFSMSKIINKFARKGVEWHLRAKWIIGTDTTQDTWTIACWDHKPKWGDIVQAIDICRQVVSFTRSYEKQLGFKVDNQTFSIKEETSLDIPD
jgi:hypothetical protein